MDIDVKLNIDFNSLVEEHSNFVNPIQDEQHLESLPLDDEAGTNGIINELAGMQVVGNQGCGVGGEGHPQHLEPRIGLEFDSIEDGKKFYYEYAARNGFRARAGKCRTSLKDNSVIMKQYTCFKEGFNTKKQRHGDDRRERRKRISVREGCKALIQLSLRGNNRWVVTKFVLEHTHPLQEPQLLASLLLADEATTSGITNESAEMEVVGNQAGEGGEGEHLQQQEPQIGLEFESLEAGKKFYYEYAERNRFRARAGKCRTSLKDNSVIMKQFTCFKEGFNAKKQRHGDDRRERQNRISVREGCKALIQLSLRGTNRWVVTKFVHEHTHPLVGASKVQKVKKRRLVPVNPPEMRPLFEDLNKKLDDEIMCDSILGGGESFGLLEYLKTQESKNPAFFYSVQVDVNGRLTNVFWASAEARTAYSYFGDVVVFDTTYKKNKSMMPFAPFTGLNHHLQPVIFGCSVLVDDSEASLTWLFKTFLVAMCGIHPKSLVTDYTDVLSATAAKVFPETRHRICKWQILSKCKHELPDICSVPAARSIFKRELKKCIDQSETVKAFESNWQALVEKYNLRDNLWMQSLYEIRKQWAKVYLKDTFFAELSPAQRSEGMNKFFQRHFEKKATFREFIVKFDQAMAGQHEKEVKADFASIYAAPALKTGSPIERQAAETYTKTIVTIFQEELVQSSGYLAKKIEDGDICKYNVTLKGGDGHNSYIVTYHVAELQAICSCGMFVFSGILCRHALRIFLIRGLTRIPDCYFLKRWKQIAKSGPILYESASEFHFGDQSSMSFRCNDLCLDIFRYAQEGGTSAVIYKVAKDALRKAFAEVAAARKVICSNEPGK